MKIAFRADASTQIGIGHVMRCLTLAEALHERGHECVFICRAHRGHLGDLIARKGFELHLLATPSSDDIPAGEQLSLAHSGWLGVGWQRDAEETRQILSEQSPDWLIVDHYALDASWERELKSVVGQIMAIDDLADRDHDCSLLLDQNLGREPSDYDQRLPGHSRKLIGPKYALLRQEFVKTRPRSLSRRQRGELRRILVSLGGVDMLNATGKILEVIAKSDLSPEIELDIVMGASAPHLAEILHQSAKLPFRSSVNVDVDNMAERMCLADLSIGAAGSTSWERCCLGLPSIMVILADNQRSIANALVNNDCAFAVDTDKISELTRLLLVRLKDSRKDLERLSYNSSMVCDGLGASRAAAEIVGVTDLG